MRAGLAGGGARNKARYQPPLTHSSWVNSKGGWYQCPGARAAITASNAAPSGAMGGRVPVNRANASAA
jgi:hypothetical protein